VLTYTYTSLGYAQQIVGPGGMPGVNMDARRFGGIRQIE
jgi:hypothetical protein